MANSDGKFLHESLQDRKSVKSLLEALTKAIGKGEITLSDGDDDLGLPLDDLLTLRIKANRSDGNCVVNIRLSWSEDSQAPRDRGKPSIQ
ncbi:amphi-Trp domain-containing protein [Microbulbifer sp. S227A]|uniref:amphi-Trp domain-containing protein n=1 Tax=Microbulbifer sp. S227A TaxID=3415131 RepID=UPI003C7AC097